MNRGYFPEQLHSSQGSISQAIFSKNRLRNRWNKGFALVVVLSLMLVLLILSVGLLSLSAIELRSSSQGSASARARANARLALQLAIGQLQLHAGPDTRITATSDILTTGSTAPPNRLTGVWKSRKLDPSKAGALSEQKEKEFLTWLVSNEDESLIKSQSFGAADYNLSDPVILFSQKILGTGVTEIAGGRVPVSDIKSGNQAAGHYAYNIQDEGVKARIDLGSSEAAAGDLAAQTQVLGVGQNPGLDRLKTQSGAYLTVPAESTSTKLISLNEGDIGFGVNRGELVQKLNDLTPYSVGLMTNVVKGGLKKDLNLIAETASVPKEFAGKGIYATELEFSTPPASDPSWNQALGFARIFSDSSKLKSVGGSPVLIASAPSDWNAMNGTRATTAKPSGPVLLPSVAKVQVIFSLTARDNYKKTTPSDPPPANQKRPNFHGPWDENFNGRVEDGKDDKGNTKYKYNPPSSFVYLLDLIYTPLVTLHNPYNVTLEFPKLQVDFKNVPFKMMVERKHSDQQNFMAQSSDYINFQRMSPGVAQQDGVSKKFGMTLQSALGANPQPIKLLPGETKVFSPEVANMNNFKYLQNGWSDAFWDIKRGDARDNKMQETITATPGWRGEQYGFEMDYLQSYKSLPGSGGGPSAGNEYEHGFTYSRGGTIPLKSDDLVRAKFIPGLDDKMGEPTLFTVEVTLPNANPDPAARTSMIEFDFADQTTLLDRLKATWPSDARSKGFFQTDNFHAHNDLNDDWTLTLPQQKKVKPIARFSAYAKSTHGGVDESNIDGSYAGKPWLFNNYTGPVSAQNIKTQHPAGHPYELNLEALPADTENVIEVDPKQRGNFISGQTITHGVKLGTLHDIPLGPIQSVISLNGANIGSSYYNPTFNMPIGNSCAHPALATGSVVDASNQGADHSYLLNSVLFDGFYCSGIQSNTGPFGNGKTATQLGDEFIDGTGSLPDQRWIPYLADGIATDKAKQMLAETGGLTDVSKSAGYKDAAALMLFKGAFNVNSTSVDAWKAMLSSMAKTGGQMNLPGDTGSALEPLEEQSNAKGARFSRFRLPNAGEIETKEEFWQGVRELEEKELDELAEQIVDEVKKRGPFLSMGEFVNRQVGDPGPLTQKGALQAAIDETAINENAADLGAGYEIDQAKVSNYGLPNGDALDGNSAQGAPGSLMQADLLTVLGNAATVRSDTFVIRAYGDAVDSNQKVLARAYCEAVVQRFPEYVNGTELSTISAPTQSDNKKFGRRFQVLSFRWLNPDEV